MPGHHRSHIVLLFFIAPMHAYVQYDAIYEGLVRVCLSTKLPHRFLLRPQGGATAPWWKYTNFTSLHMWVTSHILCVLFIFRFGHRIPKLPNLWSLGELRDVPYIRFITTENFYTSRESNPGLLRGRLVRSPLCHPTPKSKHKFHEHFVSTFNLYEAYICCVIV